jgi:hypothetical protein
MQRRILCVILMLSSVSLLQVDAEPTGLTIGFGLQYFLPLFGPAKDLDPNAGSVMTVTYTPGTSSFAVVGRSGYWRFTGGPSEDFEATVVPFLAGSEYRFDVAERTSVMIRLLVGASWLKTRGGGDPADPPLEDAQFTDRELRLAGSGGLLARYELSRHLSVESGVVVDVIYFQESDYPGFVGFPLTLVARF